ncbi:MAG: hypothetical protein GKR90_22635 [Pseudomonadales bacterium]|nr:hypothetical protein [Pseudomonadales bacterium]
MNERSTTGLIGQSFAIVASILLAFAIDAWWEDYKEQEEIRSLLEGLVIEIEGNLRTLETEMLFHRAKSKSAVEILQMMETELGEVNPLRLDELINDIMWWSGTDFATGTLDSIVNSGGLKWVEPIELRSQLSSWKDKLELFKKYEQQDWDTYHDKLLPFLALNSNLAQLGAAADGRPGMTRSYEGVYRQVPDTEMVNHKVLLQNQEFHSLVIITNWDQGDFEASVPEILEHGRELLRLTKSVVD